MPNESRIVAPGPSESEVRTTEGDILKIPKNWALLPPGDAGMTRRLKSGGPTWTVKAKRGRRVISLGVWASAERIATVKTEITAERGTEAYAKRQVSAARRREKKQSAYVDDFNQAVISFLNFSPTHFEIAKELAIAVTQHATPVGSGTVARTQRIPIQRRAESAVIAWMRHQTTAYDNMKIPRIKGKRREIRRMLAAESKQILKAYRNGDPIDSSECVLQHALRTRLSATQNEHQD